MFPMPTGRRRRDPSERGPRRRSVLAASAAAATGIGVGYVLPRTAAGEPLSDSRRERAQEVARDICGTGPDGTDLRAAYLRMVTSPGPAKSTRPRQVAVVGAGLAGLTTAWLLRQAGHEVTVVEANARIGGRIKTVRDGWQQRGQHAEAGADRLPEYHRLTLALVRRLGLTLRPYLLANSHRLIQAEGVTVTRQAYAANPATVNRVFGVREGKTARALLDQGLDGVRQTTAHKVEGWTDFLVRFDEFSLRRYLVDEQHWAEGQVELVTVLEGFTARMQQSLTHSYLAASHHLAPGVPLWEVTGGMDQITGRLAQQTGPVRQGLRLVHVDTRGRGVRLTCSPESGHGQDVTIDADAAVIAVPMPCLRFVAFSPALSYGKQRAVEELHQEAGSRVLLEFSERWWEAAGAGGGGVDVTGSPLRAVVYPSYPDAAGGIVAAACTSGQDAQLWDGLTEKARALRAVDFLADLHGPVVRRAYTGRAASQSWAQSPYSLGAAAVYGPGQAVTLGPDTRTVEAGGRLVFAGCGTSSAYAGWMEGAVESACRAVVQLGVHVRG